MDSILNSVKSYCNIYDTDTSFDTELIININSVLNNLTDLGVGPDEGYIITGADDKWSDFIGDEKLLNTVPAFVGNKVKKIFDPPQSSTTLNALDSIISELEWRINRQVDSREP